MYKTVSTMCSRVRGPARSPFFVTCPVTNTVILRDLANSWRRDVQMRTWVTEPGADGMSCISTI